MSLRDIQQKIAPILRDYGVRRASVFGSMARHEHTDSSDVDILIEIGTPMGLITYSRLARELEEALGVSVDLVTSGSLNTHLRPHIERDLTPVYEG